jgi:putative ABC transport system permease protein
MLDDLRFALRRLRHSPGFTVVAVLTLALAIGANTAIFSVADAVLFRPLPYDEPERIFVLRKQDTRSGERTSGVPYDFVRAILDHHEDVEAVGLRGPTTMMHHGTETGTEVMETFAVSPGYLSALGARPYRGRLFTAEDIAEPAGVVVLSYESWRRRLGGDEGIVGTRIRLGTAEREVIGILPPGFLFPSRSLRYLYSLTGRPDFVSVALPPVTAGDENPLIPRGTAEEPVIRLRAGITREQAQARLDGLAAAARAEAGLSAETIPVLEPPRALLFPVGQPIMLLLLAAAGLVLVIGSTNLANMLVARTRQRQRDVAVRMALGATGIQVARPILFEGLLVGLGGATLALLVTTLAFGALERQVPEAAYGVAQIGVDARVAVFALALGVLAALCFAALPSWRSARMDVQPLLRRSQEQTAGRLGAPLLAVQVALAIVLVCGAAMAAQALVSVLRLPLGFDPQNVAVLHVSPIVEDDEAWSAFFVEAVEALARHPDVVSAGAGRAVPLVLPGASSQIVDEGGLARASVVHVLPGYIETAGVRLVRGRVLTWADIRGRSDAAVVSDAAAALLFPGQDPIGRTLRSGDRMLEIVGLAADVRMSLEREVPPPVYATPAPRMGNMSLFARVRIRSAPVLEGLRQEIVARAPDSPVTAVWWSDRIDALTPYRQPRFQALVLGGFAALALGLTALGIFAIVALLVASRTREMGVRMALGATPRALVGLVVRQALTPVAAGVLLGAAGVYWVRGVADAQLTGVDASDPLALAVAVVVVLAAALLAAWLPAQRASRVDPAVVLRAE